MATEVLVQRLQIDDAAVAALGREPGAVNLARQAGADLADLARSYAPHSTGAGAASISGELVNTGEAIESEVSWDDEHHYMWFRDAGTIYQPADRFMERALDAL